MNFSSLIEKQIKSVLGWSIAFGMAVLIIFGSLWMLDTKERTHEFIISHIKDIVEANVNSQNAASIDGELNRIISTWSETENFKIRADVFLNGKHWAHAGELQPFGWPSILNKHEDILPSGEKLTVTTETDLLLPAVSLIVILSVFFLFFVLVFFNLRKFIRKTMKQTLDPLELRVNNIKNIASNLLDLSKLKLDVPSSSIRELDDLDSSLNDLIGRIHLLESNLADVHFEQGQIKAAEKLAHGLRGAVASLQLTVANSKSITMQDKEKLSAAARQIISVSENVLKTRKNQIVEKSNINIVEVIKRSIASKENEITNSKLKINFKLNDSTTETPIVYGIKADLETSFSNVISNAVEAIKDKGNISVDIKNTIDTVAVEIKDDGCGISEVILPKLAKEGFTYGKENGNGLGLFHLKQTIESMNGHLNISSQVGKGTSIQLELPLQKEAPKTNEIVLFPNQTVVIIDDDSLIHNVWDIKLSSIKDNITIVHIHDPIQFHNWMEENNESATGSRQYIFDYEFTRFKENGLDLIEKYNLVFESVLISGIADRPEVKDHAKRIKVQAISKENLEKIEVKWEGFNEASEIGLLAQQS